jgi:hypothetical protein
MSRLRIGGGTPLLPLCLFVVGLGTSLPVLCGPNQDTYGFTRSIVNVFKLRVCSLIARYLAPRYSGFYSRSPAFESRHTIHIPRRFS